MKESAGEANVTVITIVLIGLVAAAGALIIPSLMRNTSKSSCCQSAGGTWTNGKCMYNCDITGKNCTSTYTESTYWNASTNKCVGDTSK